MNTRGLTLLELVAAMAIFALVAVMGLQALSGSLRMRDALLDRAEATADLGQALALLRHDLGAALPLLFFPPGRGAPASALQALPSNRGFALSAGALGGDGVERVEWRFDPGTGLLSRQSWPTLYPVSPGQAGPEVAMLDGVARIGLRSYWPGFGWQNGLSPPTSLTVAAPPSQQSQQIDADRLGPAAEIYSDLLPLAVEVTVDHGPTGPLVLVESLQ